MKTLILLFLTTLPLQAETISWVVQGQMKGENHGFVVNSETGQIEQTELADPSPNPKFAGPRHVFILDTGTNSGILESFSGERTSVSVLEHENCYVMTQFTDYGVFGGAGGCVWVIHLNTRNKEGHFLITQVSTTATTTFGASSSVLYGWVRKASQ